MIGKRRLLGSSKKDDRYIFGGLIGEKKRLVKKSDWYN